MKRKLIKIILLLSLLVQCRIILAQSSINSASAPASSLPITLMVDAGEAHRKVFHARLTIPVTPGSLTLLYPKWIPGEHSPNGPIINLIGLKIMAGGKSIAWHRDALEMYAFHCEIPDGVTTIEVALDYLSPLSAEGITIGTVSTALLANINWNLMLLYPEGRTAGELTYAASLRLPPGWKYGTALPVAKENGDTIEFKPVSLATLVDSPVLAGAHFRTIRLTDESPSHQINVVSDNPAALNLSPELVAKYSHMVAEAGALFGAHHYQRYQFLLTLSDKLGSSGLEHHECDDDRFPERTFFDDDLKRNWVYYMPHGLVHSWNGKYRIPEGLVSTDFNHPLKTELLWVYEGLTTYLCEGLTARSRLWSAEEYRDALALKAADLDHEFGRTWRSLADTAVSAQLLMNAPSEWAAWRRGADFYDEAALIWFEADLIIRKQSEGRRSLNDFCRNFFGGKSGPPAVKPYTFDNVVEALNEVLPYDWKAFFTTRLNSTNSKAHLAGIEGSGWRLVYNDTPNLFLKSKNISYSIGLKLKEDGTIFDLVPGLPAEKAGLVQGMKLIAVNGRHWSPSVMNDILNRLKSSSEPLELLLEDDEFYRTYRLDYHGGVRYPHLERDPSKPDLLEQILKPLTSPPRQERD